MTQCDAILKRLQQGPLTEMEALNDPDIRSNRLAARVYDLKRQGHTIAKRMVEINSGKKVAHYYLAKGA